MEWNISGCNDEKRREHTLHPNRKHSLLGWPETKSLHELRMVLMLRGKKLWFAMVVSAPLFLARVTEMATVLAFMPQNVHDSDNTLLLTHNKIMLVWFLLNQYPCKSIKSFFCIWALFSFRRWFVYLFNQLPGFNPFYYLTKGWRTASIPHTSTGC